MTDIDKTLQFIQQFSERAISDARNQAGRVTSWELNPKDINFDFAVKAPNMKEPPAIGDLLSENEKQDVNIAILNDAAEAWITKYFPGIFDCLSSQPDEWACKVLAGNGDLDFAKRAFDAAWHEGRDRAYTAARSEKEQIAAMYSLRGFSLPQGAFVADMVGAEIRASDAVADINRQQIIKDVEMRFELIKLAVQTSTQLKTSMMQMLASFFGKVVDLARHEPGTDKLRARAQAYSAFISGLSNYYNVELGFEKLRLDVERTRAGVSESNMKMKAELSQKGIDSKNAALGQAARGFADAAGAAANAASSLQAELYSGALS